MKKPLLLITAIVAGLISMPSFAANKMIFTTIDQAQQYCPAPSSLLFTQKKPKEHNGNGLVTGSINGIQFTSMVEGEKAYVTHPQCTGLSCTIADAQFRNDKVYGHISGNFITCFYSYNRYNVGQYHLTMQGNQTVVSKN